MLGVDLDGFPSLSAWLARVEARPAVATEAGIVAAL
jgi:glutathione S-transferase